MLHADCAQGGGHGVAARSDGKAILRADQFGEFLFEPGSLRHLAFGCVVAVQASVAHDVHGRFDRRFGDRFLLGEIACETLCHALCLGMRAAQVKAGHVDLKP